MKKYSRATEIINFKGLARELQKRGFPLNEKNFFKSRIGEKYNPIVAKLEQKIEEFLLELDEKMKE